MIKTVTWITHVAQVVICAVSSRVRGSSRVVIGAASFTFGTFHSAQFGSNLGGYQVLWVVL